jgi:hypothetical protein
LPFGSLDAVVFLVVLFVTLEAPVFFAALLLPLGS